MKKLTEEDAFLAASSRCALREYCCADWLTKFSAWGLPVEQTKRLVQRLVEEDFINENRYARAFAHDKTLYNGWGRMKTRQALAHQGICRADIEEALAEIDEEAYLQQLKHALKQKAASVRASSSYERRQKLARFALGRGYEASLVWDLLGEEEDFVELDE